jgi:hypothetical protein
MSAPSLISFSSLKLGQLGLDVLCALVDLETFLQCRDGSVLVASDQVEIGQNQIAGCIFGIPFDVTSRCC